MKTGLQRPFECAAQVSVLQAPMPETPHAWRVGRDQITALVSAFTRPTGRLSLCPFMCFLHV